LHLHEAAAAAAAAANCNITAVESSYNVYQVN